MSLNWLTINKKLLEGITLVNLLSTQKFTLLLKRIAETDGSSPFTNTEIKKLGSLLQLNDDQSLLLTQSLTHVWKQSVKFIFKPANLQKDLHDELKLDGEKAEEFVKLWIERIKEDCGDLDKRKKLDGISWQINLQTASNYSLKEIVPKVRLQLTLTDIVDTECTENVTMDLDEEELVNLYTVVEKVQAKLDALQALT